MAVVSAAKLTKSTAAIVKSGPGKVVNVNVAVALCPIPSAVPSIVTEQALATLELQESVAWPDPFRIVPGLIGAQVRSARRGRVERVTIPVKPAMGFTMMVDIAGVFPSARTILGRVASILKSGTGIEPNVEARVACNSRACDGKLG